MKNFELLCNVMFTNEFFQYLRDKIYFFSIFWDRIMPISNSLVGKNNINR